jgi:uncharacterized paraquat-inducible protein A
MCSLEITDRRRYRSKEIRPLVISTWRLIIVPFLMVAALGCLIGSWSLPFVKLDTFYLYHYQYSLFHVVLAMSQDREYILSILICFFCVLMPVVKLVALALLWTRKQNPKSLDRNNEIVKAIGKWSMLDVFTVAYTFFLFCSDDIVPGIVYKNGLYFMITYLIINYALDVITNLWIK